VAADNVYHEVIQVEVRDQSQAALTTVQRNVEKTESDLNRVSKSPFNIVVKVTDLVTRPLEMILSSAASIARRGIQVPISALDKMTAPFKSMMGAVKDQGSQIIMGVGQGIGMGLFGLVTAGLGAVKESVIGMNSTLETSTLQFETLMGNADDARAHVADLFDFAKKTPFETQPVIDASRLLRTFGGSALDTMDNLTLFGNASAATSSDIKEVSFWFGRAYAAIQAGQPFGEARMRLQELAILSPQAAAKLDQLEKSGAKGDVIWKAMTGDLGRFNGAMDRQASTWEGLTSTLSDSIKLTSAKVFQPLFKVAKNAVNSLNDVLSSDAFMEWADKFGNTLANVVQWLGDGIGVVKDFYSAIFQSFTSDPGALGVVYDLIKKIFGQGVADFLNPFLNGLMKFIPTLQSVGRWLTWAFQDLLKGDFKSAVTDIKIAFQELTGVDLTGVFNAIGAGIDWLTGTGWPAMQGVLEAIGSFIVVEVVPKLGQLWAWIGEYGMAAWNWFTQEAWPAVMQILQQVKDFIETQVLPRLQDLAAALKPLLEDSWNAAQKAAQNFYNTLTNGQPSVQQAQQDYGILAIVLDPLVNIATNLGTTLNNLGRIWAVISAPLQGLIGWLSQFADKLWLILAVPFLPFVLQLAGFLKTLEGASAGLAGATGVLASALENAGPAFDALGTAANNMLTTIQGLPAQMLQAGKDIINGLIQGMASVDVGAWIQANVVSKIPDFIRDKLGIHSPSTVMADIGSNLMQGLLSGLNARLPDIMSFVTNLSNVFGGTDVGGWIAAAISATGVPDAWAGPLSQIIQYESGGNPMAANLTDVNAQNGDPSVGLMQLTGSNRARYTPAGLNPLDPVAQIIAGIRYIQDRYGDISNVPGVRSLAAGGAYQPYDSGGVLPPGLTLAANSTGANEFVLTPGQMSSLGGGGGLVFAPTFNIDAPGAAPGVGEEISAAVEAQASQMFALLGSQLRVAFGNLATEGGAT
jgi:transglycosylase-like protein with SLT domain